MSNVVPASQPPIYASMLLGQTLTGLSGSKWTVTDAIPRNRPGSTGGTFSAGYIVVDETGRRAYAKALDFSQAFGKSDMTVRLQMMTTAYNYERDLLLKCGGKRIDRVVLAIDHGEHIMDPAFFGSVVPFLVLELATGDVRAFAQFSTVFDLAWSLRSLHQVALGLMQLHRDQIVHQDVKPSNVMVFAAGIGAKVGDLGRATSKGSAPPHEQLAVAGDKTYAPPELLYGSVPSEWNERRFGCDAYLLGSLIMSFFTGASMTSMIQRFLPVQFHWLSWTDSYANVLPYIREAFNKALDALAAQTDPTFRADVVRMCRELCDPDLTLRGHPRARAQKHGNRFSLERYVSELNLLASRAERGMGPSKVA